jgi:cell division septal protein FtsQ
MPIDEGGRGFGGARAAPSSAPGTRGSARSELDVADARDAVLLLKGDTTLVRLGNEQFAERLQSYLDLAPALRERVAGIDYVDLRFDERVYVRPQGSGSRPEPGSRKPRQED